MTKVDYAVQRLRKEASDINARGVRPGQLNRVRKLEGLADVNRLKRDALHYRSCLIKAEETLDSDWVVFLAVALGQTEVCEMNQVAWSDLLIRIKAEEVKLPRNLPLHFAPAWLVAPPDLVLRAFRRTELYDPKTGGLIQPPSVSAQSNTPSLSGATWLADPEFDRLTSDSESVRLANSKSTLSPSWPLLLRELDKLQGSLDKGIKAEATLYFRLLSART